MINPAPFGLPISDLRGGGVTASWAAWFDRVYSLQSDITQASLQTFAVVANNTGATIPKGTVVGFAGVDPDGVLSVAPYLADGSSPSLYILGVTTEPIPDSGSTGNCIVWGHLTNIDTSAFNIGDILYASPTVAGAFTNVKPTAPENVIPVAAVLVKNAVTGAVFVRPTIEQQKRYGEFSKTTNQSPAAINTEYLLTFDSTRITNGVVIGSPTSRIVMLQSGLYKFDATIQLTSGSASAKNVWLWYKKNEITVSDTARVITSNINGGYSPISLSQFFSLEAGQYVEIAFAADNTDISVSALASTAFAPAAPAVLLAVTQVQQ